MYAVYFQKNTFSGSVPVVHDGGNRYFCFGSTKHPGRPRRKPGDIICLAAVDVDVFQSLHIVGNAFDPNTLQPVVVKWIAFDQPTNTRILKVVDSQVNTFIAGGGDARYSCINNNSGIAVTFNLSPTVQ